MSNVEILMQNYPEFMTLPKLPYVIDPDKAEILSLCKCALEYADALPPELCHKDRIDLARELYFHLCAKNQDDLLSAYAYTKSILYAYGIKKEDVYNFINALNSVQFQQLIKQMQNYHRLNDIHKLRP